MSNSLRDQLLQLGFKTPPKPEPQAQAPRHAPRPPRAAGGRPERDAGARQPQRPVGRPAPSQPGRPSAAAPAKPPRPAPHKPRRSQQEIDLGKAYALRAQKEKDERIAAEREKQEAARLRREARAKLSALIRGNTLNDANADVVRHFEYGGKIKRVHVTEVQLKALNAGELGVVQADGRYLLVTAALLDQAESVYAPAVALRVDPNAPVTEDPYADPQYQVPDDLIW